MKYEKIINAFKEAEEKDGVTATQGYMAYVSAEEWGIAAEEVGSFVNFVHEAWIKDEQDISVDTLLRAAAELVECEGMAFLLALAPREFLSEYCVYCV